MKKVLFALIALICVCGTAVGVAAADEIYVVVNGRTIMFDTAPKNVNGRILVPFQAISKELGAEANWDDSTKTVTAKKGDAEISFVIDSTDATVNGESVKIDQPAVIVDGMAFAPLRFTAEAFGGTVEWDAAKSAAYITLNSDITDAVRFNQEYPQVGENNIYIYASVDEIIDTLANGTGVVYLGMPSCPWCQAYTPILNDVAMSLGIDKIRYFDITQIRQDNTEDYQKIVSILKDHLDLDADGNPRVFVPDITVVKNGEILGHDNETSMISGDITPNEYWTGEKIAALIQKLKAMMSELS